MNLNKKTILAISIPAGFVVFIVALFIVAFAPKLKDKTNVVFYNLSDAQVKAITMTLEEITSEKGKPINYSFIVADTSLPIEQQINKKTDLVFANYGTSALKAAETVNPKKYNKVLFNDDLLKGTTLSVYQKSHHNQETGLLDVIPLLLDYNIVDNRVADTWQNIVFAGGSDQVLLDTVTSLTEAIGGKELYDNLINYIEENRQDPYALNNEASPSYAACYYLGSQIKEGNINNEVLRMKMQDVIIYMEAKLTDTVFNSLSSHRTVNHETIIKFKTQDYYPYMGQGDAPALDKRYFVAPVICAVPLSAESNMRKALTELYSAQRQEQLCYRTGLAPVLANCNVPDMQSDDARYWIAASNAPLTPLSDYFTTDEERAVYADAIRSCINIIASSK